MTEIRTHHLRCTRCQTNRRVIEIPLGETQWEVDETLYVCILCRKPVNQQLGLEQEQEDVLVDRLEYDPAIADIGF